MTASQKYAAAFIQLAIVLVGAVTQISGHLTLVDGLQLIPLAGNAILVYLVPLFGVNARSGWKTGVATIGALAAAAIPYATNHHITGQQILVVTLAGLQVFGAHLGVRIRNDALAAVPAGTGTAATAPRSAAELPTDTTITRAITSNGGEFIGEAAR